jgi:hypothetical protein
MPPIETPFALRSGAPPRAPCADLPASGVRVAFTSERGVWYERRAGGPPEPAAAGAGRTP